MQFSRKNVSIVPLSGVVAADEEQVLLRSQPATRSVLAEDHVVEDQQDAQPHRLDDELDQEVGAERHLLSQPEAGEGQKKTDIAAGSGHAEGAPHSASDDPVHFTNADRNRDGSGSITDRRFTRPGGR